MKKRAYISLFDKENVVDFARELVEQQNFEIVSTGGTYKLLKENGISVTDVPEVRGCPEMLNGKLKSIHPAIFGGILADTTKADEAAGIEKLNLVNLY